MNHNKMFQLLQLCDSAFPTGGFSHSMGLDAYMQFHGGKKGLRQLEHILVCSIENTGSLSLPFVAASFDTLNNSSSDLESNVQQLVDLDRTFDACSTNHIAKRASTRQGKSMLETCVSTYPALSQHAVYNQLLDRLPHNHQCIVHGVTVASLHISRDVAFTSFMFGVVRTLVASAVRLDLVGPMEGQNLQAKLQDIAEDVIQRNKNRGVDEACIKFPMIDVVQNTHDTLFSKLFYS